MERGEPSHGQSHHVCPINAETIQDGDSVGDGTFL
jgi:hypothetical protein